VQPSHTCSVALPHNANIIANCLTSVPSSFLNNISPVIISANIHPTLQISTCSSYSFMQNKSSGARYYNVQMRCDRSLLFWKGCSPTFRTDPKSVILASLNSLMRMFSGFRSRCMIWFSCKCLSPDNTCYSQYLSSYECILRDLVCIISFLKSFTHYSITNLTSFFVLITSSTEITLTCLSLLSALISLIVVIGIFSSSFGIDLIAYILSLVTLRTLVTIPNAP